MQLAYKSYNDTNIDSKEWWVMNHYLGIMIII